VRECQDYERRWSEPDEPPPRDYGYETDPVAWAVSPEYLMHRSADRITRRCRTTTQRVVRRRLRALLSLTRLSAGGAILAVCAWNLACHGIGLRVDEALDVLVALGGGLATFVAVGNTLDLFD